MAVTHLNLEIITPMFLRGQDNSTPELRPPAFKALFRYWWRAAIMETNIDNLRDRESSLFGNTKRKSPLSIRISGPTSPPSGAYSPLPHRPGGGHRIQGYSPNGTFNLTLTSGKLNEYEKIATLSFLLGGVGNRSRRGFGSIRNQNWSFQNVSELQDNVYQTLDNISPGRFQQNTHGIQVRGTIGIPDYPAILAIYFGTRLWNKVDDILYEIGQATHNHKDRALGDINPRMASPIHVRVQKVGNGFVPIATQLNSVPNADPANYERKQQNFINAIIS